MTVHQLVKHQDHELGIDLLAWRVQNAKRREAIVSRNRLYSRRPRQRSTAHMN